MCVHQNLNAYIRANFILLFGSSKDAYILQQSGRARITCIARSNYDSVKGEYMKSSLNNTISRIRHAWSLTRNSARYAHQEHKIR